MGLLLARLSSVLPAAGARALLATCAAAMLAACAGGDGGQIHYTHYGSYSASIAHYGARDGQMALAVFGNPTASSQAALAAAVADGLRGTHIDHRTVFVPTDPPPADSYRTVVVFGGTTLQAICGPTPVAPATPTPGQTGRLAAAYCHADQALSFVSARHPPAFAPEDPALRRLLRYVGYDLFPPENPDLRRGCGIGFGACD